MPKLANGTSSYVPKHEVTVTHWSLPDKDGDSGIAVWDGETEVTDSQGNVVYHYNAPDGFHEVPTMVDGMVIGHTHVRKVNGNARGPVRRATNRDNGMTDQAVNIHPGETLVEYADGSFRKLLTDKQRDDFVKAHNATSGE